MFRFLHRFEIRDGIKTLVLYVYTPVDYEFADEIGAIRHNAVNTASRIRGYAQKYLLPLNIDNPTVTLIINGVIIGSVELTKLLINTKG